MPPRTRAEEEAEPVSDPTKALSRGFEDMADGTSTYDKAMVTL